jgi:hypothetical protein
MATPSMSENGRNARTFRRTPGSLRLLAGFGLLWFLFAIPFVTDAGVNFLAWMLLFYSGAFLGLLWLGITIHWLHALVWRQPERTLGALLCSLCVPLLGCMAVYLGTSEWPLRLRLAMSEPWMLEYVTREETAPERFDNHGVRLVGTFLVRTTWHRDGMV